MFLFHISVSLPLSPSLLLSLKSVSMFSGEDKKTNLKKCFERSLSNNFVKKNVDNLVVESVLLSPILKILLVGRYHH